MQFPSSIPWKRRLNLKFVLISMMGLGVIGLGTAAIDRAMRSRRDRQSIEWAQRAFAEGRYEDAALQYARVVSHHPNDAGLSLKAGDTFYQLSGEKPEALQDARVAWDAALHIDPSNLPALSRLLHFHRDLVEVRPSPAVFHDLGEVAEKMIAIAPSDNEAATSRLIAQLAPWFATSGPGNELDAFAHDKLMSELAASLRHTPVDGNAILFYALACARRAIELQPSGSDISARQVLDRAEQQISRTISNSPQVDSNLLFRAGEGLSILADASSRMEILPASLTKRTAASQPATAPSMPAGPTQHDSALSGVSPLHDVLSNAGASQTFWPTWDMFALRVKWQRSDETDSNSTHHLQPSTRPVVDPASRYFAEARVYADRAASSLASSDPRYVDVRLLSARMAQVAGDFFAAERIYRDTLLHRPGSLRVQVALADQVSETHPEQAIGILDQPENVRDAGPGPAALTHRQSLVEAAMLKARIYLDTASTCDDPTIREANIRGATVACDTLATLFVASPASLKLKGRLRGLQGRHSDAIHAIERAMGLTQAQGHTDAELPYLLAVSLRATHEPQAAIERLRSALEASPSFTAARLLLTQTLLDEGQLSEAATQVERLEKTLGDESQMLDLRVQLEIAKSEDQSDRPSSGRLLELWEKLPEATAKQKLRKAQLAVCAGEPSRAIRLLQRKGVESSVSLVAELGRAFIANGMSDQADVVLTTGLKTLPNEPELLAVQRSLGGAAAPEQYERELSASGAGEFVQMVRAVRKATEGKDLQQAKDLIAAASRIKPDEPLLLDAIFKYDMAVQQWGGAGACAEKLARSNFDRMEGLSYELRLDRMRQQYTAALLVARQMSLRYGAFPSAWGDYGDALQALGRFDRAIESFRHALALEPNHLAAIKGLAACNRSIGHTEEAREWARLGLSLAPGDNDLREMELLSQLGQEDPHPLIAARQAAVTSEPQRLDNVIALARVYVRVSCLDGISDPTNARDALDKAARLLDGAMKKWSDEKSCALWAAHVAALSGDVAGGKQILRRFGERDVWARRPEALAMLADYCLIWGDPSSAAVALRDEMSHGGSGAPTARRLASFLLGQGAWQDALDVLRPYSADPLVQQEQVHIAVAAGQAAEAERELKAAHDASPSTARVMTLLGTLYMAKRNDELAALWLDRGIEAGDEAVAYRERGALRLRDRYTDPDATILDLAIAREARLTDESAALLLSEALLQRHDAARAIGVLQTALTVTPSDKGVRLSWILLEQNNPAPNWEKIAYLIEEGRAQAPSDCDWDAAEARMWLARGNATRAATLMRHAVQLATTESMVADVTLRQRNSSKLRSLLVDELTMLLAARVDNLVATETDEVISRYGQSDMVSALAHVAKAIVQRRSASGDGGMGEFNRALAIAFSAGGFGGTATILDTVAHESGIDVAIGLLNSDIATLRGSEPQTAGAAMDDGRWDLLRINLLIQNNRMSDATTEIDRIMPRLGTLPVPSQVTLLRMAVVANLQAQPIARAESARSACLALLQRLPDDPWTLNNLAELCIDYSHPPEVQQAIDYGLRAFRASERQGEVNPRIADTYGWALTAAGRGRDAIEVLEPVGAQLLIPESQYHLAKAYLSLGDAASALPHLTKTLERIWQDQCQGRATSPDLRRGVVDAFASALGDLLIQKGRILLNMRSQKPAGAEASSQWKISSGFSDLQRPGVDRGSPPQH